MGRKVKPVTIMDDGRDRGKTFILTEMPAAVAEKWAYRAVSAVARTGIELPTEPGAGWATLAILGMAALVRVPFEEAEPLLDQMMDCVRIAPDPAHIEVVRPLNDDDIEEVMTRLHLRAEVFKLHTGFSFPAGR